MIPINTIRMLSSISAVFPAYNDYATIASMVLTALVALRQVTDDYEVIVTDDGSTDGTAVVLDEMARRYPELRVFHHPKNRGYGAALRTGFSAATKDWIFYTDGDAQYNPMELVNLVKALRPDLKTKESKVPVSRFEVDIVNGYKITRSDSLVRKVAGQLYHSGVRQVFKFTLRDVDCDFRLFKRSLLDQVKLESEDGTVCLEMVKKFQEAGFKFVEVPVHHFARPHGVSQFFSWRHLAATARDLVSLWWKLIINTQK